MAGTRGAGGGTPCVVLAGTASGVGKTALSTGLMAALRARGLKVQAFKAGPDFLDPMHHAAATGRPSINLDTWMLTREQVVAAYRRHTADADVAVVEGVMGLFDGRDGATEAGSTAQLAKWLGAPVLLVLDASALARSAAAVAKGYIEFDPELRLGGLLFNMVGGDAHTIWLRDALTAAGIKAPVLGGVPKNEAVVIPERHLGLHMPADETVPPNVVEALAELVSTHVDLDALLAMAATAEVPPLPEGAAAAPEPAGATVDEQPPAGAQQQQPVRIAVAHDAAFCFYYNDNLALLREAGAELVYFSPLTDPLPADVAGVYLGGGYPERFAAQLADNRLLRASVAAFAKAGGVVYAECGGLLYLSRSIQPQPDQAAFPMVGVFPFKTVVSGRKLSMGYVEVATREGCPLFPAGARVRGQVHHHSEIVQESAVNGLGQALSGGGGSSEQGWQTCYTLTPQIPGAAEVAEGFFTQNVLASYVHLHFGNCPEFAASLVCKCRGVDVAGVSAAVTEAQQTAAYLESAVASLNTTPLSSKSGRSAVHHSRSSPDLAAKQGAAGVAGDVHRHLSEDGGLHAQRHHSLMLPPGDPSLAHHMMGARHASLQPPGMVGGLPGRSLSPTTALSKVVSLTSLNSYSAHAGPLPPGETLSPPLTDSPQQLSPRELEQQRAAEAPHYFGGAALHPQHMQQYAQAPGMPHGAAAPYGYPPPPLPHQPHAAYSNGSAAWGVPEYTPPPPLPPGYSVQQSPRQVPNVHSWPRLHQPGSYASGASGRQQSLSSAASPQFYAANGAAAGSMLPPPSGGSRHSRSDSFEQRPASASAAAMLMARSPSPLDLHGLERLEGQVVRNGHTSATPHNWQHSHHPSDKIVSLSPGATEMLWALGLGARVAAVSDACDYPPDVVARAKARRSFAAASASSFASLNQLAGGSAGSTASSASAAASRRESPLAAQGRSSMAAWQSAAGEPSSIAGGGGGSGNMAQHLEDVVDEEVLARERPGLVVYEEDAAGCCATGSLCSGAPAQGGMGQAVLEALVAVGLQHSCRVVCVRRRTLSDVLDSMLAVGEAAGVRDEALRAVDRLRARLRRAAGEAARAAAAAPHRPRVLVLRSLRPLRTVGWWLPDQVMLAGGTCDLEEAPGDAEVELTWQQVRALAPDVLIVAGMQGGSALRPLTDLCSVAGLPGWWNLPAVRASAVYVADAALFCRAGPRLVEGVECLARLLWGEQEGGLPGCACPEQAVLKLSLRPGQRCRPRLLPNHFVPVV